MRGSHALLVCSVLAVLMIPALAAAQFGGLPQPPVGGFPQAPAGGAFQAAPGWPPQQSAGARRQQSFGSVTQPPVRAMPAAPVYDPYTDFYLTYHQAAYDVARAQETPTSLTPNQPSPFVQSQIPAYGPQGPYSPTQLSSASAYSMQGQLPFAPTILDQKPFSDYQPPPPVSPYMNLYRRDTGLGVAGNYYLLVRPSLDQQVFNQQSLGQIRDLQSAGRATQTNVEQLDRRTTPLRNPAGYDYFMDLNRYYPGLSR